MSDPQEPRKNGLAALLSGYNGNKLIALLVILLGGGNLVGTETARNANEEELQLAIKEIHELHHALDDALSRQKEMADGIKRLTQHQ